MEYKSGFIYNFNRFSQITQIPGLVENPSSVGKISFCFHVSFDACAASMSLNG